VRKASFFSELRRRHVWRVAAAYVTTAVVIATGTAELYDDVYLPDFTPRLVLILLIIGLPVALTLAWALEVRTEEPRGHSRPLSAVPTVAVLPFDNLSPDSSDEYFSSGLTEEITADFSAVSGLRVISRTSATHLKASGREVGAFARELGIDYLLEGSVRKAGHRIRVTAQLIDAAADSHLWSRKYDGTLTDVFDIQESVARAVVAALRVHLTGEEERALGKVQVGDLRAYEHYLRARDQIHRFTPEALDRAVAYLEQARMEIGDNPLVLSGLAYAYAQYVNIGMEQEDHAARAEQFARRALALDAGSAEALTVLGFVELWFRGDSVAAIRNLEGAIRARPDDSNALMWLAVAYAQVGRVAEARTAAERLVKAEPLTPENQGVLGVVELYAGRYDEALECLEPYYRRDPANPMAQVFLALALFFCRKDERLRSAVAQHADSNRKSSADPMMVLLAHAVAKDTAAMHAVLEAPETRATFRRDSQCPGSPPARSPAPATKRRRSTGWRTR